MQLTLFEEFAIRSVDYLHSHRKFVGDEVQLISEKDQKMIVILMQFSLTPIFTKIGSVAG